MQLLHMRPCKRNMLYLSVRACALAGSSLFELQVSREQLVQLVQPRSRCASPHRSLCHLCVPKPQGYAPAIPSTRPMPHAGSFNSLLALPCWTFSRIANEASTADGRWLVFMPLTSPQQGMLKIAQGQGSFDLAPCLLRRHRSARLCNLLRHVLYCTARKERAIGAKGLSSGHSCRRASKPHT